MGNELIRKMVAEAIGTFILVFVGTSALMLTDNYVFAFGFALIAIVYAIGHVSGAHVNPAVTLSLAITGRFPMFQVPYYWAAQVIGALLASLVLRLLYGNLENLGATQIGDGYSMIDGFVLELVMTAIFVFVIHAVATDERSPAAATGLAIGGTLLVIQVAAGEVSGGSVNPARSLAPAIVSGTYDDLWIYLIAPFIGAILGAIAYEFIGGADATQISTQVGTTTEPHRGERRGGRGGRGGSGDHWERPEGQRRPGRPTGAERDRQKRDKRPDRQQREPWQQRGEQRGGQHDDQRGEQDPDQRADQRRVREPRGARGPQVSDVDQDDPGFQQQPDFDQEDAVPQRRPQRRQRPEQSPEQSPEQRTGQRRRRPPIDDTQE